MLALSLNTTDMAPPSSLSDLRDLTQSPTMADVVPPRALPKGPSPQPAHLAMPMAARLNGNGHRTLRSATVGYVAEAFQGKAEQMTEGKS